MTLAGERARSGCGRAGPSEDNDAAASWALSGGKALENRAAGQWEILAEMRARRLKEGSCPTRVGQQENQSVHLAVALLELEAARERLTIARPCFRFHRLAPTWATNQGIPRALVARVGQWHLDAPSQRRVKARVETSQQRGMARIP